MRRTVLLLSLALAGTGAPQCIHADPQVSILEARNALSSFRRK